MRKLYSIIVVLFVCGTISYAQPVLNASDFSPTANYEFNVYNTFNVGGLTPGGSGANQTWDYSALTLTADGKLNIVPVASTPYTATFPTANFAAREVGSGGGNPTYIYYKVSSTEIETVGESDGGAIDAEIDHSIFFKFPYVYGTVFTDSYQNQSDVPNVYSYTATYDAYGTLKTPYATYNNVIRQKKVEVDGAYTYTDYSWFTANPFKPIMGIYYSSNGVSTSNSVIVYADPSLKVDENSKEDLVTLYPNPTTSILNLNFPTNKTIDKVVIVDVTGRIVKEQTENTAQINVEKLAPGLYVIEAYFGKEKFTTKFVKK